MAGPRTAVPPRAVRTRPSAGLPRFRALAAASLAAALIAAPAAARDPAPGTPPLTSLTERSGGPVSPARAALRIAHADLAIEVMPDRHRIAGVATLTLTSALPQRVLEIDLDRNLPVSSVRVDGAALRRGAWRNPAGRLAITLPRPLAAGASVVVRIAYGGTPHVALHAPWDDGIVWARTPEGAPWVGTTAEGYGCDLFWPCLDFPQGEPGSVDLHVTVPKGLSAPAGGVLRRVEQLPDGRSVWHWRAASPNPYSVALNVAPYARIDGMYRSRFGNRFPMVFYHLPGDDAKAAKLFEEFAPALDFLEATIGPYPWGEEKMGIVQTPYLGMEHQTLNAYGNGFVPGPNGFDELFQHELAHEWFGNQMTAANWDDYWLHEGFAQYMQPLYGRAREGAARYAAMMAEMRGQIANRAPIVSGKVRTEEEVYQEEKGGPGNDIYVKGAWVLHSLRNLIGDEAFFDATRRLVYGRPDPKPGNFKPRFGSTDEFVALVNQVTGKDYRWFFDVYLREAALPKLVATRTGDRLTLAWDVPDGRPFPMPVEISVDGKLRRVAMPEGRATLTLPATARLVLDPEARVLHD